MKIKLFTILLLIISTSCSQKLEKVSLNSEEFKNQIENLESSFWSWEDDTECKNKDSYVFDLENKSMILTLSNPVEVDGDKINKFNYELLWAYKNGFRCKIKNEKRLDMNGKPVEWDLIFKDNNTFYWKRNDWGEHSGTKHKVKCN